MEELLTDTEFYEIAARDRAKVVKAAKQIGYKEGAFDGRASVFQAGFDVGYEEGFRNAFVIGRYQGLRLAYEKKTDTNVSEPMALDLLLTKPTRGQCQVCVDGNLLNKDIPVITDIQTVHSTNVSTILQRRYKHIDEFVALTLE